MKNKNTEEKFVMCIIKAIAIIRYIPLYLIGKFRKLKGPKFRVGTSFKDYKGTVRTITHCEFSDELNEYAYRIDADELMFLRGEWEIEHYVNREASDE